MDARQLEGKPIQQVPAYPDPTALAAVEGQLAGFPPLVFAGEARKLKRALAKVAAGKAFLLQGGDCAESFAEHSADNIRDFFRVFLQMAVVLTFAGGSPVVKVGRIAGQFAKPRSAPTETVDGVELPSYRGDIINDIEFTPEAAHARSRAPAHGLPAIGGDAQPAARLRDRRLRQSRERASLDARLREGLARNRRDTARSPSGSPRASTSCAPSASIPRPHPQMRTTDFYTSHEALLLGYEQAMTRVDSTTGDWYATSGHMLWIGDRTRQPDHAHVEYCRGIKNPIGLKCGPVADGRRAPAPDRHPQPGERGRPADPDLPLRRRQGRSTICPALVRAVKREGRAVVWSCDPMHGNTIKAGSRLQDAAVRADHERGAQLLRDPPGRRHPCRRHPSRDDRQERDRMHRRRPGADRGGSAATATTPIAIRASTPSRRSRSRS